jgi:hypothetical protein
MVVATTKRSLKFGEEEKATKVISSFHDTTTLDSCHLTGYDQIYGENFMQCTECQKTNTESQVMVQASVKKSLGYYPPYFDSAGSQHTHDENVTTTNYVCSAGHRWMTRTIGSCQCGWPHEGESKLTQEEITKLLK